jgi:hypothetical protein
MSELKDKAAMEAVVTTEEKKPEENKVDDSATASLIEVRSIHSFQSLAALIVPALLFSFL